MNLPAIDIPIPPLPIEIPVLLHPVTVHFAVALPVILLLVEIINLFMKRRALNVTSSILIILIGLIFFAAFLTGKTDGKEAFSMLSDAGKEELGEHKLLGIYLVYATGVLLLFKIISLLVKKVWGKAVYLLLLIAFIVLTFLQGKDGGELVYEYGANVKALASAKKTDVEKMEVQSAQPSLEHKEVLKEEEKEDVSKSQNKESEDAKTPQDETSGMVVKEEPKEEKVDETSKDNKVGANDEIKEEESVKSDSTEENKEEKKAEVTEAKQSVEEEQKKSEEAHTQENPSVNNENEAQNAPESKSEELKEEKSSSSIIEKAEEKVQEAKEAIEKKAEELLPKEHTPSEEENSNTPVQETH